MDAAVQAILEQLLEGNRRFAGSLPLHPNQDSVRRSECATGQKPVAAVLGCSDSRVPPEILFDCGIGDLFVVRTAGTVADNAAVASLEYAVDHLHIPLVIVLGHTSCGAVTAAVNGSETRGALGTLLNIIKDACTRTSASLSGETIDGIIQRYTVGIAASLRTLSPVVGEAVEKGACTVIPACYSLHNGRVELL